LLLLCSCTNVIEENIRVEEYGEQYAVMDCWWSNNDGPETIIFYCHDNLETDLISGQVRFAIERDSNGEEYFSICGRDIILNSGYSLHDTLIRTLTDNTYSCHHHYEGQLGNEFDTIWDEGHSALQVIWRPPEADHKVLTIYVPDPEGESLRVSGTVYYKFGIFN
tara:strand:- start:269 stop:763 length:495 start_codon:yes stop_codon:yes gene_type:complete